MLHVRLFEFHMLKDSSVSEVYLPLLSSMGQISDMLSSLSFPSSSSRPVTPVPADLLDMSVDDIIVGSPQQHVIPSNDGNNNISTPSYSSRFKSNEPLSHTNSLTSVGTLQYSIPIPVNSTTLKSISRDLIPPETLPNLTEIEVLNLTKTPTKSNSHHGIPHNISRVTPSLKVLSQSMGRIGEATPLRYVK